MISEYGDIQKARDVTRLHVAVLAEGVFITSMAGVAHFDSEADCEGSNAPEIHLG